MKITILGAGAFGRALGKVLTDNKHIVNYYDPFVYPDYSLDAATYNAEAIVVAVPSNVLPDMMLTYPNNLRSLSTVIATKGLSNTDVFKDFSMLSAVSGPAFAQEIIDGKSATLTASDPFVLNIFQNGQIFIELCEDLKGILLCGSLKNIYAIGAGYHSESENEVAALVAHAHNETQRYLEDHGAKGETANYACGLGDLILTCTSPTSRNYTCGQRLKKGERLGKILEDLKTVEGVNAIKEIENIKRYPILAEIANLLR